MPVHKDEISFLWPPENFNQLFKTFSRCFGHAFLIFIILHFRRQCIFLWNNDFSDHVTLAISHKIIFPHHFLPTRLKKTLRVNSNITVDCIQNNIFHHLLPLDQKIVKLANILFYYLREYNT